MSKPDTFSSLRSQPALMHRIAFAHFDFDVVSSEERRRIGVRPGRVDFRSDGEPGFTISAQHAAWAEFAKPRPRPGYNDVVAMIESGHAEFQGDALVFFRHLFFVKGVVGTIFKGDPAL
jgi:hypothetical protein